MHFGLLEFMILHDCTLRTRCKKPPAEPMAGGERQTEGGILAIGMCDVPNRPDVKGVGKSSCTEAGPASQRGGALLGAQ